MNPNPPKPAWLEEALLLRGIIRKDGGQLAYMSRDLRYGWQHRPHRLLAVLSGDPNINGAYFHQNAR